METTIECLKEEVQQVLTTNILPYWIKEMLPPYIGEAFIEGMEDFTVASQGRNVWLLKRRRELS